MASYKLTISLYNRSTGYEDELCIAAGWLYRATGEQQYLDAQTSWYSDGLPWAFSWDDKNAECQVRFLQRGDFNINVVKLEYP